MIIFSVIQLPLTIILLTFNIQSKKTRESMSSSPEQSTIRRLQQKGMMIFWGRKGFDNFIMSYPFNHKQAGYSSPPNFTPWSQEVGGAFMPGPAGLPLSPFTPFPPFHSYLIHQQNNFYNSNFTLPPPPLFPAFPPNYLNKTFLPQAPRKPLAPKRSSEVIVISDDEREQGDAKGVVAVVREKRENSVGQQQLQDKLWQNFKQKQVIQSKRQQELRDALQRREHKIPKKAPKPESIKEEEYIAKKKKISKERCGFRMSDHLKELMQISRYRDYRPDQIMVGPQFQAKIDDKMQLYKDRLEWLQQLREDLQLRKHD